MAKNRIVVFLKVNKQVHDGEKGLIWRFTFGRKICFDWAGHSFYIFPNWFLVAYVIFCLAINQLCAPNVSRRSSPFFISVSLLLDPLIRVSSITTLPHAAMANTESSIYYKSLRVYIAQLLCIRLDAESATICSEQPCTAELSNYPSQWGWYWFGGLATLVFHHCCIRCRWLTQVLFTLECGRDNYHFIK